MYNNEFDQGDLSKFTEAQNQWHAIEAEASTTPFSDQNVIHRRMLFSVYQFLTQNFDDHPSRSGSHWENIGFQGNDPATDFRGVGVLGLLQFLRFVSNKKQENLVHDLFALSRHPVQNFPFAAVGLNFTKILLGLLKMGKLENLTNSTRKSWSLFDCLTFCYDGVFSRFFYVWNNSEPKKTIVDFGFVMKNLENYANDYRNRVKWIKCHNM
uniref:ELMO domain-containing protein n=1 Tax=Romanomermis culicivorax TaxID=13658 RepID=A0A915JB20_ROMCU